MKQNRAFIIAIILFCAVVASNLAAFAQTNPYENRLISVGPIPEDFTRIYSDKYFETLEEENVKGLKNKNSSKTFAAVTNYSIDNLLKSGRVIYGDPITQGCNQILDKLLQHDPTFRKSIRLYTLKSNDVNAYSTHQGIIIITTGLITRLQNESQLAYVLAHEIAHVIKGHSLRSFRYDSDLFEKDVSSRKNNLEEKILRSARHSQKNEYEADNLGWDLYIKAGFPASEAINALDRLLYAYLPAAQDTLRVRKFESGRYLIDSVCLLLELEPIAPDDDVNDARSTHPNILSRKDNIQARIDSGSFTEGAQNGLVDFEEMYRLAYRECVYQHLLFNDYVEAWILLEAAPPIMEPFQAYLDEMLAMSWYGLQLFGNQNRPSIIVKVAASPKTEGVQEMYHHFLKKIKRTELNVLATREIWKLSQQYPQNKRISGMLDGSIKELTKHTDMDWKYFANSTSSASNFQAEERLCHTCHYAFDSTNHDLANRFGKTEQSNIELRKSGPKTLAMFSPRYFGLDNRLSIDERFLKSEEKRVYLENLVNDYANRLKIEIKTLDAWNGGEMTTDGMNQYSVYMDWLIERSGYQGETFEGMLSENIKLISGELGTDYVGFSMYWNLIEHKKYKVWLMLGSIVTLYGIPFYLKWQLTPYHFTGYSFIMMNAATGEYSYVDIKQFNVKYRNFLIKAHLYNSLYQIAE